MSEVTIGGYVPGAIGRVFLRTFEGLHAARHLYEKFGFRLAALPHVPATGAACPGGCSE